MNETTTLPDPGEIPALDWLDKTTIDADPLYQRPLDNARVDTILRSFTWRSFGALVVVPQADGRYHTTDGQHRLEAAKLHPQVTHVSAVIVKAEDVPAEAAIFVDINRKRKNVTGLELFFALLAAGDEDAETVRDVASRAGVRIPKYFSGDHRPGDTIAVAAVQALIGRRGAMRARQLLQILAAAELAPITANHIKAVELILTDGEFCDVVTIEEVDSVVKAMGLTGNVEAKRFAAAHGVPAWKGLANVWFQQCRKSRHRGASPAPAVAKPIKVTKPANIPVRNNAPVKVASVPRADPNAIRANYFGDPPPGRSALDQRKSA